MLVRCVLEAHAKHTTTLPPVAVVVTVLRSASMVAKLTEPRALRQGVYFRSILKAWFQPPVLAP